MRKPVESQVLTSLSRGWKRPASLLRLEHTPSMACTPPWAARAALGVGMADLIALPPLHNTQQRAYLRHRCPLSPPHALQRCCHPGREGATRGDPGSGTSAAQGLPSGLAWRDNDGDDAGECSTAEGTQKARANVVRFPARPEALPAHGSHWWRVFRRAAGARLCDGGWHHPRPRVVRSEKDVGFHGSACDRHAGITAWVARVLPPCRGSVDW